MEMGDRRFFGHGELRLRGADIRNRISGGEAKSEPFNTECTEKRVLGGSGFLVGY
jgi:hypothetical protein